MTRIAATIAVVLGLVLAGAPAGAEPYEEAVPEALRGVVTEAGWQAARDRLAPAVEAGLLRAVDAAAIAASPCAGSIGAMVAAVLGDPGRYRLVFEEINAGFADPPAGYGMVNPWRAGVEARALETLVARLAAHFTDWCTFLPQIAGDQDTGLKYILDFAWFYYRNPAGQQFVLGRDPLTRGSDPVFNNFLDAFSNERGAFMDSPASTGRIAEWIADPRIEIADYTRQAAADYDSWNDFFARDITVDPETETIPSRPVTMPERDYVVSAPTDCIMNPLVQRLEARGAEGMVRALIENPLQLDTVIDVKGFPIGLDRLLGSAPDALKQQFVGGSGLACVLMPNTYHHFHAPVSGTIVHAEVVDRDPGQPLHTFGYYDFPNWVPADGNVGRPGTDFSQFEVFERGVVIIRVRYSGAEPGQVIEGHVASIPVGLDTIGSVVLDDGIVPGAAVTRGYTRLGNFYYGGSLNILLFSKGLAASAVQVRLGNQITILDAGSAP